jgi:hypothetical protein
MTSIWVLPILAVGFVINHAVRGRAGAGRVMVAVGVAEGFLLGLLHSWLAAGVTAPLVGGGMLFIVLARHRLRFRDKPDPWLPW